MIVFSKTTVKNRIPPERFEPVEISVIFNNFRELQLLNSAEAALYLQG